MLAAYRLALWRKALPAAQIRVISTSKNTNKPPSVTTTAGASVDKAKTCSAVSNQNWMSYGFDIKSKSGDRQATHSIFFAAVTLCLVGGGFVFTYAPDYNMTDWSQREAFLELKRREDAGLPLVDPNLIDPSRVVLPPDADLADGDIII